MALGIKVHLSTITLPKDSFLPLRDLIGRIQNAAILGGLIILTLDPCANQGLKVKVIINYVKLYRLRVVWII